MNRSVILTAFGLSMIGLSSVSAAEKRYGPGVTDTEIKLGQTMPYSGPISALSRFGRVEAAYLKMINAAGGINGRKVTLVSLDDAFAPAKTVQQTRKLVEDDDVLAIVGSVGTPPNLAIAKYLNGKAVPQILVLASAPKLDDPVNLPWTTTFMMPQPVETGIYAEYLLKTKPDAKIAVIYQNDDLGKGNLSGLKAALGSRASTMVVAEAAYDITEPTVEFTNPGAEGLRCRYAVSCLQRSLFRTSHSQGARAQLESTACASLRREQHFERAASGGTCGLDGCGQRVLAEDVGGAHVG